MTAGMPLSLSSALSHLAAAAGSTLLRMGVPLFNRVIPRNGYAIKREIAARTDGKLKLGPGVLYGSINRMLEMGRPNYARMT